MATVTIQPTVNMLILPTSAPLHGGEGQFTSFTAMDDNIPSHFMGFIGTFTYNLGFDGGTTTSASFNFDSDFVANISVANLDFQFDYNYYMAWIYAGNYDQVLRDMLAGDDTVTGTSDGDTLTGFAGADKVLGLGGGDHLIGDVGADRLFGGGGVDTLYGGGDADILVGGLGADSMTGNAGADTFLFQSTNDAPKTGMLHDTIEDFTRSDGDKVDLSQIDARLLRSGNQAFEFIGGANFTGNASDAAHRGELRAIATADGFRLSGDVTGDRIADFVIDVATFAANLKGTDFLL